MSKTKNETEGPWNKPAPKKTKDNGKNGGGKSKLTEAQIAEARERAEKAGRRYPNLIDNMYVAKKAKEANSVSGRQKVDDDYFD